MLTTASYVMDMDESARMCCIALLLVCRAHTAGFYGRQAMCKECEKLAYERAHIPCTLARLWSVGASLTTGLHRCQDCQQDLTWHGMAWLGKDLEDICIC